MKSKRAVMLMFMCIVLLCSLSAQEVVHAGDGSSEMLLDMGYIRRSVNLVVGIFSGGYLLIKAALDIFHAVRNSSEDQNALKRAIGNLAMNVMVIASFMFCINYVMSGMSDVTETTDITEVEAKEVFFAVLSGALVGDGYII